jgi:hypothetical protein
MAGILVGGRHGGPIAVPAGDRKAATVLPELYQL